MIQTLQEVELCLGATDLHDALLCCASTDVRAPLYVLIVGHEGALRTVSADVLALLDLELARGLLRSDMGCDEALLNHLLHDILRLRLVLHLSIESFEMILDLLGRVDVDGPNAKL